MVKARAVFGLVVGGLGALVLLGATPEPAAAQSDNVEALIVNIQRLRTDLDTLQKYVYGRWKPPEKDAGAAARAGGRTSPNQVARVQVRLTELEIELRKLTGRVEEVGFKVDRANTRLDKLVEDVDFRLVVLERDLARVLEAMAPATATTPEGAEPVAEGERPAAQREGEQPGQPPAPGTLGTITESERAALPGTATAARPPEPEKILPEGTVKERYEFARRLLRQGDWGDAERAFGEFISSHPDDDLAGNAQYWLGETFYVRKDYDNAAATFLDAYQKYPASPKAAGNLLKLGMSLVNLGHKKEACQTFAELLEKHADAAASILRLGKKERQRAGCP